MKKSIIRTAAFGLAITMCMMTANTQFVMAKSEVQTVDDKDASEITIDLANVEIIFLLQNALNSNGYNCGTPDGYMNDDTKKAITSYEISHGMKITNKVSVELLQQLNIMDEYGNIAGIDLSESNAEATDAVDDSAKEVIIDVSNLDVTGLTLGELLELQKMISEEITARTPEAVVSEETDTSEEDYSESNDITKNTSVVKAIQNALTRLGYECGNNDGVADENTYEQVFRYAVKELNIDLESLGFRQNESEYESYSYDTLARYPDEYTGKKVTITGEVVQVIEYSATACYRIATDKTRYGYGSSEVFMVMGVKPDVRILEDDIVTVCGIANGLYTYETVLGATLSIPYILFDTITIN